MTAEEQKAWEIFVDHSTRRGGLAATDPRINTILAADAVIKRAGDVEGLAEALFGNEMLYSDYDAESRTGPVPKIWSEVSEGDKGYFREIALTVTAWLKEGK